MTAPDYREQAARFYEDHWDTLRSDETVKALAAWASRIAEEERAKGDALAKALEHQRVCAVCAEDWEDCDGGREAQAALDAWHGRALLGSEEG